MAKSRKLSKNRMLLELIESGLDAQKRKQQQLFALAERLRNEQNPEAANRLGDELGRMLFGGGCVLRCPRVIGTRISALSNLRQRIVPENVPAPSATCKG